MKQLADTALLELMQVSDDKAAFDELYRRYWRKLYSAAYAKLQNDADAKDCLQDVFVSLWHKRKEITIHGSADAYFFIALKYRVLNLLRNRSNYGRHLDIFAAIPPGAMQAADDRLALREIQQLIRTAIDEMPEKMREIYLLSRQQELSLSDMAQQLGLSVQTVKNQVSNALRRIKAKLAGYG